MTPAIAALASFAVYALGYRFYSGFLSKRVFALDPNAITPAHAQRDDVDYVPTRPTILFGHHFASIAGLAPMLGPAVAVIWGWLPALIWVVGGALLIGCVHDLSAMVISVRNGGMSVGQVAEQVLGPRGRTLFHMLIFFGIALAMGVFVFVLSRLFALELAPGHPGYPGAVLPSGLLMIVAMVCGVLLYRKGYPLVPVAAVGFAIELFSIWLGMKFPTLGLPESAWPGHDTWVYILLGYAFMASVLPVWALLQARDFLNGLLLYLGLGLAYLGLFVGNPQFAAPAFNAAPEGAPDLFPSVFIIIACGAASGFHGLVSSGTTAKQLDKETHARPIGYGGMIGESLLGLLATLACTAGMASADDWHGHYGNWNAVQGLAVNIDLFIGGTTTFLVALGIPVELSAALIAMVVVSFALTTLDSATRLLRFNIEEIAATMKLPLAQNRYVSTTLACAAIGMFAFYKVDVVEAGKSVAKPAGLALWQLFGTTNQVLAALTLGLVTLYLKRRGAPIWPTALPCLFMLVTTATMMVQNLSRMTDPLVRGVGLALIGIAAWLSVETLLALKKARPAQKPAV